MNKTTISVLSAITLLATAGCTADVTAPSSGSDGTPRAPTPPAASKTPAPETSSGTVSITGYTHSEDGAKLPGVDVCIGSEVDDPAMPVRTCVTSDADGKWTIPAAPRFTRIRLTFEKADFAPVLRVVETEYSDIELPADENRLAAKSASSFMGVPTDVTKGSIEFAVTDGTVATAVTLRGLDGTVATARYLDADGNVSPNAQAGARGGFANLAPGYYAVTFGGGGTSCFATSTLYGYPQTVYLDASSGKATVMVPVVDGYLTAPVGVSCAPSAN